MPNYPSVKTEVPSHGFSVTVPNNCAETDVFDRQLNHNTVQFSPSTQSRTPPDSTYSESYKDGSQEVCVSIPLFLNLPNALPRFPLLLALGSLPTHNGIFTRSHGASGGLSLPWFYLNMPK